MLPVADRNSTQVHHILLAMSHLAAEGNTQMALTAVAERAQVSESTARRLLLRLIEVGDVVVQGKARATRYSLPRDRTPRAESAGTMAATQESRWQARAIPWSQQSVTLLQKLEAPLHTREPIAYQRDLLDAYLPGITTLLPAPVAQDLLTRGRLADQQPAGTYARKVLEQLLVELSWSSSKLEGNTYSLLDTERLFKQDADGTDQDASMLLNHKHAIEFLVAEGPMRGLTTGMVRNIHSLLMDDLLPDDHLGAIRETPVYITGSTFVPLQISPVIGKLLDQIVTKARQIPNPVEAAFFLWVQIAYLQPFADGNKRTSRISANIPLTLYNCSPLAFMDVDRKDYALAMMGLYECNDLSAAIDLFVWTYDRSILRYKAVLQSTAGPDPLAIRFRAALISAIGRIVSAGETLDVAVKAQGLSAEDEVQFIGVLGKRLDSLQPYNSARYRLPEMDTIKWIEAGRRR